MIGGKRTMNKYKSHYHGGLFDNTRARISDWGSKLSRGISRFGQKISSKYDNYQERKNAAKNAAKEIELRQKRDSAIQNLMDSAYTLGYTCSDNSLQNFDSNSAPIVAPAGGRSRRKTRRSKHRKRTKKTKRRMH